MSISEVLEPRPKRPPLKRCFIEALGPENQRPELEEPAPKRRREESPVLILDWLSKIQILRPHSVPATFEDNHVHPDNSLEIPRPPTVPAKFNANLVPLTVEDVRGSPKSPLAIDEMGDRRACDRRDKGRGDDDNSSLRTSRSTITRVKRTSSRYRSVLEGNDVRIDPTGEKISEDVRGLLNTDILKKRTSPPLSQQQLMNTMRSMNKWGSSTENAVNGFISSPMFPIDHPGLSLGGNSPWPRAALPYDQDYGYPMSTPKPDYHLGYNPGMDSGFSKQQLHVVDHPYAKPYTQPGTGNILPFLTVELKSEATGGTLFHAENQAAGSGTYCQRSMEWLLDQAKASQNLRETDTVAFSMSGTGRLVVLSVHWHSLEDRTYYMSYVKGFQTSEKDQVQACHSTVKNIIDWAVGTRHKRFGNVLQQLFPLSQQWTDKRTATAAELDDPGNDDEEDDEEEEVEEQDEVIEVRPKRVAKNRRSGLVRRSSRSSAATQSFTNTQSLEDRRSAATKNTSVTKGSKPFSSTRL